MSKRKVLKTVAVVVAVDYVLARLNQTPQIKYVDNLPFNYNAQTIPPFGIYIKKEHKDNALLLAHELEHWNQYRKTGALLFFLRYGLQSVFYGYDKMPFEVKARKKVGEHTHCQTNYTDCVRSGNALTIKDINFRK